MATRLATGFALMATRRGARARQITQGTSGSTDLATANRRRDTPLRTLAESTQCKARNAVE
jgi:hypothetical protein